MTNLSEFVSGAVVLAWEYSPIRGRKEFAVKLIIETTKIYSNHTGSYKGIWFVGADGIQYQIVHENNPSPTMVIVPCAPASARV